jgi:hypothetical protein
VGDGDSAASVERPASFLAAVEIPLLASFPYLLGDAERVPTGPWSIVGVSRALVALGRLLRLRPVVAGGYDRFHVELSAHSGVLPSVGVATGCLRAVGTRPFLADAVARSDPRTPPGGEFDWGGTSVKE